MTNDDCNVVVFVGGLVKAFSDRTWHVGRLHYIGAVPASSEKEAAPSCCLREELDEGVSGTWFGVELVGASVGKGKSDGMVSGLRFFQTAEKCAVFVHAACICPHDEPPPPVIPEPVATNVSTAIIQSVSDVTKMKFVE